MLAGVTKVPLTSFLMPPASLIAVSKTQTRAVEPKASSNTFGKSAITVLASKWFFLMNHQGDFRRVGFLLVHLFEQGSGVTFED